MSQNYWTICKGKTLQELLRPTSRLHFGGFLDLLIHAYVCLVCKTIFQPDSVNSLLFSVSKGTLWMPRLSPKHL